ncbi:MAG TPA: GNAT family N-acetyltransferase [Elusimicrobiota bacterium]|nr:GNAT family N-acetyltransferase [Elusimicrobiota bacterium]
MPTGPRIQTHRLELIAGNRDIVQAEIGDRAAFARLLDAEIPAGWPLFSNDEQTRSFALRFYETSPDADGWCKWYFLLKDEPFGRRVAVGSGGFWGPPSADGTVEFGYAILSDYQGRGYATEAVNGLVGWAFGRPQVSRVIADTFRQRPAAIRVLEKNRFVFVGPGAKPGTVRYELPRAVFDDVWQRHSHL